MPKTKPMDAAVKAVVDEYPSKARKSIRQLRSLILERAAMNPAVGELEETLKWSEPSYLTKNKAGSTIRIAWKEKTPDQFAMYLNCQTSLVDTYRTLFPELTYEGNRAVAFKLDDALPVNEVSQCIDMALTYHLDKRKKR